MPEPEEADQSTDDATEGSVSEQLGFSGPEEELEAIIAKMHEIREAVQADLLANWPSPWKGEDMVQAKVTGRLGSHKAFQVLLVRRRELEATLGVTSAPRQMDDAEDPMGSYAIKLAKEKKATEAAE